MAKRGRPPHPDILTPREWEVHALLRESLSNEEIAERLGISLAGAKYHVSEILGKLGVESREEAAAWTRAQRPWWQAGFAPFAALWRSASASWLSIGATAVVAIAIAGGIGLLAWGLARTGGDGPNVPDGLAYVTFEPGETIAADGPGIFFIDTDTGAAEGWVAPGRDRREFELWGMSADGRLVLYGCGDRLSNGEAGCGSGYGTWYLLNTRSGEREELPGEARYVSLSPNGSTILVYRDGRLALAAADAVGSLRPIEPALAMDFIGSDMRANWSPDSRQVLLRSNDHTTLVNVARAQAIELLLERGQDVAWSPDGSAVAVSRPLDEESPSGGGVFVFDATGELIWTAAVSGTNPQWSPDGQTLATQVDARPAGGELARYLRLDVFDGGTGEPLFRIDSAVACAGPLWTTDGRLLFWSQAEPGHFVADPAAGTFQAVDSSGVPSPLDANGVFEKPVGEVDGRDSGSKFYRVDLSTGERMLFAQTTLEVSWHGGHDPLFAGDRIVFTAPHGGHGGCAEGGFPDEPLELAFQYPPFDD